MITLLRRIRRSLLESGNIRKYTFYAVGEIALVVIGILIALQINNWNQKRIDRNQEQQILMDLKAEFLENRRELEEKEVIRDFVINSSSKLNQIINQGKLPRKKIDLDSLYNLANFVATYDPRNGVLNNLISSGQINLIKNRELKSLLTNWEGALAELQEHENVSYDITINFAINTIFGSKLDLRNVNKFNYSNYLGGEYKPLETHGENLNYKEYFSNRSIINYLSSQYDMAQFAKMEAEGIFEMIDKILFLIEFEIH